MEVCPINRSILQKSSNVPKCYQEFRRQFGGKRDYFQNSPPKRIIAIKGGNSYWKNSLNDQIL